jgi:hypothetical protein
MELTLVSPRASGTRLSGKHWATPFISSQPAASRARACSGIQARTAHALGDCSSTRLGTYLRSRPPRVSHSLPAFLAELFPFFWLVVMRRIFLSSYACLRISISCVPNKLQLTLMARPGKQIPTGYWFVSPSRREGLLACGPVPFRARFFSPVGATQRSPAAQRQNESATAVVSKRVTAAGIAVRIHN